MENQYLFEGWRSFREGSWVNEIDLRSFIRHNFTMYDGDESFLEGPTQDTLDLWEQVMDLTRQEREAGGVLDMDTKIISTITSHGPGYLNKDKEKIVGFQTDKPFKRAMMPYGGVRMAQKACADNGYTMDPEIVDFFTVHRKTHNAGVFDAYTPEMRACRSSHIITGLPDAYGRGRIIGDYRRVALYGVDRLIDDKEEQKIHTCLDTSGITYTPGESSYNEKLDKLMELTDLVLLDLKHMDPQAHKELTGHDNRNILAFARYLAEKNVPVWIRHVVVPGITDDPRQLAQLGAFMGTLPNVVSLDVLPYHVMGVSKYREMGITYPLIGVEAATHEQAKKARQIILAAYRQVRGKQSQ